MKEKLVIIQVEGFIFAQAYQAAVRRLSHDDSLICAQEALEAFRKLQEVNND